MWATGLNGEQKERSFYTPTLAEAKRIRAESTARQHPDGSMTLNEWQRRYWSVIETTVRPSTVRAYERGWRLRVKPWLGHKKLEKITAGDVEEAMTGWTGKTSTRIDALSVLSRLLDGAVNARLVPLNVARLARRPRMDPAGNPRSRALSQDEVAVVLESIESIPHRRYIAALVFTGMRANEAAALRTQDVDLDYGIIRVSRNASVGLDGQPVDLTPKSHKERTVPIAAALAPHLEAALAGKKRGDLVFTGVKGGKLNPSNVKRAVKWSAVRDLLDRSDLKLHDLRHTFATLLFDAGMSANDIQAILGHASLQTTEMYSRARDHAAQRAVTALDSLFGAHPAHQLSPPQTLRALEALPRNHDKDAAEATGDTGHRTADEITKPAQNRPKRPPRSDS
ncbi:tyrosine-type recombinase/integrase [Microbacterium deminutum]|uniref:tyrosine-type recombinase/integrase n=1 Tax=Microbacterium deminutum TaxID=344164 RepID=UPI0031CF4A03